MFVFSANPLFSIALLLSAKRTANYPEGSLAKEALTMLFNQAYQLQTSTNQIPICNTQMYVALYPNKMYYYEKSMYYYVNILFYSGLGTYVHLQHLSPDT